jgi:hypothetical protein
MEDIELQEWELELLEDANEFKKFLYSLHEEYELTEVDELYDYYFEKGWYDHCLIINEFETKHL